METTKQPLNVVIQSVIDANNPYAGTMYTKDDVIRILNTVEAEKITLTDAQIQELKDDIASAINNIDQSDVCENFEFEIKHGDTISVDSFEFNTDMIARQANDAIDEFFDNL